jgi:WD40 repeat protein
LKILPTGDFSLSSRRHFQGVSMNTYRAKANTMQLSARQTGTIVLILLMVICARAQSQITLTSHTGDIFSAEYNPAGTLVASSSRDTTARIWSAQTGELLHILRGHVGDVTGAIFNSTGDRLLTTSFDSVAIVWDVATGTILHRLVGHKFRVRHGAFNSTGTRIATVSYDGLGKIWDSSGTLLHTLTGHTGTPPWVVFVRFGPGDSLVVTTALDHTARIWRASTGELIRTLQGHTDRVQGAQFTPDGSRILTWCLDSTAKVWDMATGETILTVRANHRIQDAAYSPDYQNIITASFDRTAQLWDASSGELVQTFTGHTHQVASVVFNRNGTRLLTSSFDSTARMWDVASGQELRKFQHGRRVSTVVFSPDEQQVMTASFDRTIKIWDLEPAGVVRPAMAMPVASLNCHPNPATGDNVDVRYYLADRGHIQLSVVDAIGRECLRIVDGPAESGDYQRSIDISGLSPGLYFVRLSGTGGMATSQLIIAN